MSRRSAPWWVFACAAPFVAFFAMLVYCDVQRPESEGLTFIFRDHLTVQEVVPDSAAERAGLRPGDAILAVDGQRVGPRKVDWETVTINVAFDQPIVLDVRRAGVPMRLVLTLSRESWSRWATPRRHRPRHRPDRPGVHARRRLPGVLPAAPRSRRAPRGVASRRGRRLLRHPAVPAGGRLARPLVAGRDPALVSLPEHAAGRAAAAHVLPPVPVAPGAAPGDARRDLAAVAGRRALRPLPGDDDLPARRVVCAVGRLRHPARGVDGLPGCGGGRGDLELSPPPGLHRAPAPAGAARGRRIWLRLRRRGDGRVVEQRLAQPLWRAHHGRGCSLRSSWCRCPSPTRSSATGSSTFG